MINLSPNISMGNWPMPFLDRIACVADLGFTGVDMFSTNGMDIAKLAAETSKHKITIGMVVGSELTRGLNDPELHAEIEKSVEAAAIDAQAIGARFVTVLSGNTLQNTTASKQNKAVVDGLNRLIPIAEKYNIIILLEMLNSLYDHPGYYLDDTELMTGIIRTVNHPRIKALYDMYHAGVMRGNIIEDIRSSIDSIGHFHLAGIPGRHEPKAGEQNYPVICREIEKLGYNGYIAMEYDPEKDVVESITETRDWILGS